MKIKMLKELIIGKKTFKTNEIIELDEINNYIKDLNENFYLLIYQGIRYDMPKDNIEIMK